MKIILKISALVIIMSFCIIPLSVFGQITNSQPFPAFGLDMRFDNPQYQTQSSDFCAIPKDIPGLFAYGTCVLSKGVVTFLISLGLIFFLVGVVQYVASGDNEEKKEAGRSMMIYGIIALFVMVSVWGLVNILSRSFFGNEATLPTLPPPGKI